MTIPNFRSRGKKLGEDYERFLVKGDPGFAWKLPADEWDAISLNYTSGTTGKPKGVVYHHRGAHLMGYANVLAGNMGRHPVLLWTLPMFHCNGWCFPWTLSVQAGTHVCLRQVRAGAIYAAAGRTRRHLSVRRTAGDADHPGRGAGGAPGAGTECHVPPTPRRRRRKRPWRRWRQEGFEVVHVYGLTEVYGPAVVNEWHQEWDGLDASKRAALKARQGVRYHALEALAVLDPKTMKPVPADGGGPGRGHVPRQCRDEGVFEGHGSDQRPAFKSGWFHSGDLGVMHPDGYIQLKDRSKDIIISGGENISSIEVEKCPGPPSRRALRRRGRENRTTNGARRLAPSLNSSPAKRVTEEEMIEHCRRHLARFKVPRAIVFTDLPKTSTGKIQKFVLRAKSARGSIRKTHDIPHRAAFHFHHHAGRYDRAGPDHSGGARPDCRADA